MRVATVLLSVHMLHIVFIFVHFYPLCNFVQLHALLHVNPSGVYLLYIVCTPFYERSISVCVHYTVLFD